MSNAFPTEDEQRRLDDDQRQRERDDLDGHILFLHREGKSQAEIVRLCGLKSRSRVRAVIKEFAGAAEQGELR